MSAELVDVRCAQLLGWVDIEEMQPGEWWGVSPESVADHIAFYASPFEPIPSYSTDMNTAWRVVEWLHSEKQVLIVKMDGLRTYKGAHLYTILLMGDYNRIDTHTASEGICLAAIEYAKRKGLL